MADPAPFPEFPWTADALLAQGMLAALQAHGDLAAHFAEISAWEMEDLLFSDTFNAPLLALMLDGTDETPHGSNYTSLLETALRVMVVEPLPEQRRGAQDWLLSRILGVVKGELVTTASTLQAEDGVFLSCALTRFQRSLKTIRLPTGHLARSVVVTFQTEIDSRTRQWK